MKREHFVKVVEEALDSLPKEFRSRIQNVAILFEDFPPNQSPPQSRQQRRLLLGIFHGVPATKKSVFDLSVGPAHSCVYLVKIISRVRRVSHVRTDHCPEEPLFSRSGGFEVLFLLAPI